VNKKVVLDSSVLLAILNGEPGAELFTKEQPALLANATISAVNLGEAYCKLVSLKNNPDEAWQVVTAAIPAVAVFDADQAEITGRLIALTRSRGLSLGDRACLGLGIALKAPVYTTDRAWKDLRVGVTIHVIR
jgi:PIN domain nuclease of toxin-antitoxin system